MTGVNLSFWQVRPAAILGLLWACLAATMPLLAQAESGQRTINALVANGNGLWVLEADGLRYVGAGKQTKIPLPSAMDGPGAFSVGADGVLYLAGRDVGLYRSSDNGASWSQLTNGLPDKGITSVAAHSTLDNIVYVFVDGEGIFRTKDAGKTWSLVDAGPPEPILTFLHSNMPGSMETGWLFAGTGRGVARSMDCFCLWSDAGDERGEVTAMAYDRERPTHLYALFGGRLHHSRNGGEDWVEVEAPSDITAVTVDTGGQVYLANNQGIYWQSGSHWMRFDD